MLGRAFWGGVIECARWFSSGGFTLWGLALILLALQGTDFSELGPAASSAATRTHTIFALPLGAILVAVGALLFLQFGRAKRALLRAR
ncbi:hypothetical protein [Hypericibacter sp.]|uniref:hypothetical protein n=1 Tax=Hypericibacter sp. TaxID=2705401 RepID=UPI003D6D1888